MPTGSNACPRTPSKSSCPMPWRSVSSISGPRSSRASSRIPHPGMRLRPRIPWADSIRSSLRTQCMLCPTTCIRSSSRRRAPIQPDRVGAAAADSAAVEAARSSLNLLSRFQQLWIQSSTYCNWVTYWHNNSEIVVGRRRNPMRSPKRARKARSPVSRDDLKGWKEIAGFLGQPLAVAQRWAKSGMPVSRKGRYTTASVHELAEWLGRESGLPPVHIATDDQDLSQYLKAGLTEAKKSRGRDHSAHRAA